ncbi:hypothetical protein D3218_09985 [Aureimonas flava]|uniref:Uncharacterized protein n=1 Tax=Aureimonas flava TaxID=2320271 RepID=A0A3A1WIE9_9HYPH|nr:hypothetical protein [Aureimonas flava]RIY00734.1 hypothetical protein D3218_09985 [Aureimonas flava]
MGPASPGETYRPRASGTLGHWRAGSAQVKAYAIRADGDPLGDDLQRAARDLVGAEDLGGAELGFAIVHRGEEAVWLLLHWWMPGGMLAERLWRRPLDGTAAFEPVDRPLMACVWELPVIGFERDAYVETVMAGRSGAEYLARVRPDGTA